MSNERNGISETKRVSWKSTSFAYGDFCYRLLTISVFFLTGCGVLFARPASSVMCGEKTAKTQKYEKAVSRIEYFYEEDAPRSREVSSGNVVVEIPSLKTQEKARERFEKNKETYNDLLGWRMPFDDFCKRGNRWLETIALVDIQAKEYFLNELLLPRMKDLDPDLARGRDALLGWAENNPQKIYEYFLPLRSVSRRCSRESEILEVPSELQGDRDFHALLYFLATPPINAKLQKQLPELQKTLIAYWLTVKKSKPRSRGGCGGGC